MAHGGFRFMIGLLILTGLVITVSVILLHFTFYFFKAEAKNNYGIIDVGWGLGFVWIAWSLILIRTQLLGVNSNFLSLITVLVTTIWGVRLSTHIRRRNEGKPEDYRYIAMRAKIQLPWRKLKGFVKIFLVQALFMFLIAWVLIANIMVSGNLIEPWMYGPLLGGLFVWMVGFYFQAVGDAQLASFKKNPENKGKLITTGLWALTRHPNYVGEVFMWWGITIMGFGNGFIISVPWLPFIAIFSALVVTFLLRYLSGVPLLEKRMVNHPDFAAYAKRTSIFLPRLPKK